MKLGLSPYILADPTWFLTNKNESVTIISIQLFILDQAQIKNKGEFKSIFFLQDILHSTTMRLMLRDSEIMLNA